MVASVRRAKASARSSPAAARSSRNEITGVLGNFGARPSPPKSGSSSVSSFVTAASNCSRESSPAPVPRAADIAAIASRTASPACSTSARLSRQASSTASTTCRNAGDPPTARGGK